MKWCSQMAASRVNRRCVNDLGGLCQRPGSIHNFVGDVVLATKESPKRPKCPSPDVHLRTSDLSDSCILELQAERVSIPEALVVSLWQLIAP